MLNKNTFLLIYHLLMAFLNFYMLWWNIVSDETLYFLQNFCYLTILTHTLICIYCLMILDYDIQYIKRQGIPPMNRYPHHIHTFFQHIQGMGAVVVLAYWGLRIFKPELLFPEGYTFVPEILASYSHGGNYAVLAMELLLYEQKIYMNPLQKLRTFGIIICIYIGIQTFHRKVYGYHIYPFIEKMEYGELAMFYSILFTIAAGWDYVFCRIFIHKKSHIF